MPSFIKYNELFFFKVGMHLSVLICFVVVVGFFLFFFLVFLVIFFSYFLLKTNKLSCIFKGSFYLC